MTFGKVLVIVIFVAILATLGSALRYLVKERGDSNRLAKSLTLRIGLSIALFALLYILNLAGLIEPHGLRL
ncbi:MAG: twin transmembrane helix small protein [Gammaproteobacteria bacterium]|nr:twin transmembrane helix small protein [Gammaproteobacteria bacterium]